MATLHRSTQKLSAKVPMWSIAPHMSCALLSLTNRLESLKAVCSSFVKNPIAVLRSTCSMSRNRTITSTVIREAAQNAFYLIHSVNPFTYNRLVEHLLKLRRVKHSAHRKPRLLALLYQCYSVRNSANPVSHANILASRYSLTVLQILLCDLKGDDLIVELLSDAQERWVQTCGHPSTLTRKCLHPDKDVGGSHGGEYRMIKSPPAMSRVVSVFAPFVLLVADIGGAVVSIIFIILLAPKRCGLKRNTHC